MIGCDDFSVIYVHAVVFVLAFNEIEHADIWRQHSAVYAHSIRPRSHFTQHDAQRKRMFSRQYFSKNHQKNMAKHDTENVGFANSRTNRYV